MNSPAQAPVSPAKRELKSLLRLAWPVILANLGTMFLGVVDTLMVGRIDEAALSAVALGHVWTNGTLMIGMGVVMGIDPLISQAHSRGDPARLGRVLQRGILVGLAMSVLVALAWMFTEPFLILAKQDPALSKEAQRYVTAQIFSVPFYLVFVALRQFLSCREIMAPALWISFIANFFNAGANEVLIFGEFGVPEMGIVGAGYATGLTRIFILLSMILIMRWGRLMKGAWVPWSAKSFRWKGLFEVIWQGLPVGAHMGLEIWAFALASLLAGKIGAEDPSVLAAHTVVLNCASVTFMMPLGIAIASVTRVGNLIGAERQEQAQLSAQVAFASGALIMTFAGILFWFLRNTLPSLYSLEGPAHALAVSIIPVAAAFQIFDGIQVVGAGILRGMGRTQISAWANLLGFWGLGLPLAWWLGLHTSAGLAGVWWGLALGLAVVAVLLVAYVMKFGPRHSVPLHSEGEPE
ncbi:MAG: MATE family efflux transporter [Planctomycetota bacterium]